MDPISAMSNSYSSGVVAYDLAVESKAMDVMEDVAQGEIEMLNQMMPPSPYTFDVYA